MGAFASAVVWLIGPFHGSRPTPAPKLVLRLSRALERHCQAGIQRGGLRPSHNTTPYRGEQASGLYIERLLRAKLSLAMYVSDTIVAPATPPGRGAIAIVRLSGPRAIEIAHKLWHPLREPLREKSPEVGREDKRREQNVVARRFYLGEIRDPRSRKLIDRAMLVIMPAPRSLTGEDVAELHCHGGVYLVRRIVALAATEGARMAAPGEFSRRAFLNARIDLTEAEAIADLIDAPSEGALENSLAHLTGALAARIRGLREQVIAIRAHLEAHIDFDDEEIDLPSRRAIADDILRLSESVGILNQSFARGHMMRHGARAAIVGKPNVGKSSILNLLLGNERAIVTSVPGTTRDLIEEAINLGVYPLVITDTAGIRESVDEVERLGIERARASAEQSDLLVAVFDSSQTLDTEDMCIIELARGRRGIALLNKRDLPHYLQASDLSNRGLSLPILSFCATNGDGLEQLRDLLAREIEEIAGSETGNDVVISRERHRDALAHTLETLSSALKAVHTGMPPEIVAVDIEAAAEYLSSITGDVSNEDILDAIFREFCIGK
jgi:tRNA modification GTPase